ncbi:hypothetical protein GWK47_043624 [Chionoecetes opilio]|uniref:Uncharacterized protein n=1 Tax=Chionoecetes opilio TaxID=41210 RepID=A0A8J4Y7K7_CHIOP|nr:hypothetical protein GWK47_043624 [Chionoecetes opilio]
MAMGGVDKSWWEETMRMKKLARKSQQLPKKRLKGFTPEVALCAGQDEPLRPEGDPPPPGCGFQLRINACFPKHTSSIQNDDQDGACGGHQPSFQEFINAEEPPLIVHWDGKLLPDLTGEGEGNLVDRLPNHSFQPFALEKEKLLGMQSSQREREQRWLQRVVEVLGEWGIKEKVVGMSFRHDSHNTGIHTGCCRLLEEALGKPLLNLACRHHGHRANPGRCVQGGDGAILWTNDSVVKADSGTFGPYIPHKRSRSHRQRRRPEDRSRSVVEGGIDRCDGERIQSKKVREDYRELCNLVPLLSPREKPPSADQEAGSPSTTPFGDGKGNLRSQDPHFPGSHVQMKTREGKGLKRDRSLRLFSSTRARGWRRGWRPKLRTTTSTS